MLTNFEEITRDLTSDEHSLIPILIEGFKSHTQKNPIKAPQIVQMMNDYLKLKGTKLKLSEPRLRKCVNYIRTNTILPLIATSKGYYVSYDKVEIELQVKSLRERSDAIDSCARGMAKFLEQ